METLITSLAPAFAVGLALQALIEWVDGPFIEWFLLDGSSRIYRRIVWGRLSETEKNSETKPKPKIWSELQDDKKKKIKSGVVRTLAIAIGITVAVSLQLSVLKGFEQFQEHNLGIFDYVVAGLIVSLGTDGINQIVKFVEKAKDNQEASAAKQK